MNELTRKILEVLEINPDEEFEVKYNDGRIFKARFNSKKGQFELFTKIEVWLQDDYLLEHLMIDKVQIIKKSWKPKKGEKYYNIDINDRIDNNYWFGGAIDLGLWHIGNCFKTEESAKENKDRILKLLNSDTPLWKKLEREENN